MAETNPEARRIFLSHTTELREHPRDGSFVASAEAAVSRASDVVTDMAYFSAQDSPPAEVCRQYVAQADIYVGIIGFRYGAKVSDRPGLSYTELEFEVATELGLPRLVFLLDETAALPLPAAQIIDLDSGSQQAAFRRRLQETGTTVARVASPAELETRLYQSLTELRVHSRQITRSDQVDVIGASVAVPVGRLPVAVRGRDQILRSLKERSGLVVLAGMGGVGKSTVAAELAHQIQLLAAELFGAVAA